ncbi:MAG: hypothetical protein ABWY93_04235 [Mycobacterium sp.]
MTIAWLIGPPMAVAYAVVMLRCTTLLARFWERRHPYQDGG